MTKQTLNLAYDAIESIQQRLCAIEIDQLNDAEKDFLAKSIDALKEIANEIQESA